MKCSERSFGEASKNGKPVLKMVVLLDFVVKLSRPLSRVRLGPGACKRLGSPGYVSHKISEPEMGRTSALKVFGVPQKRRDGDGLGVFVDVHDFHENNPNLNKCWCSGNGAFTVREGLPLCTSWCIFHEAKESR